MNKQWYVEDGVIKVEGKIEWANALGYGTGYTINPLQGCDHECKFEMPNGKLAICYAKAIAERFKSDKYMPDGFEHITYHPERLAEPAKLKTRAGIFLDSNSDLFSRKVSASFIHQVLEMAAETPWHIYFTLTKNAPRLLEFKYPENVWVGVSMPPTYMYGHKMDLNRQIHYLQKAAQVFSRIDAKVKWLSLEPLSFDVAYYLEDFRFNLDWAVIGAATDGRKAYQPDPVWTRRAIEQLRSMKAAIYMKGNLRASQGVAFDEWCEEYPPIPDYASEKPVWEQTALW